MDKILAFLKQLANGPVFKPILAMLNSRAVLTLIAGLVAYYAVPQIPGIKPDLAKSVGDLIYAGVLVLVGRFSLEGVLETRATLPTTVKAYMTRLFEELMKNYQAQQGTAGSAVTTPTPLTLPTPPPPAPATVTQVG